MRGIGRRDAGACRSAAALLPAVLLAAAVTWSPCPAQVQDIERELLELSGVKPKPKPRPQAQPAPAGRPTPARRPARRPRTAARPGLLDELLKGPLADVQEVVFAERSYGNDGHWYANFGWWVSDPDRKMYGIGGRLGALNLRTRKVRYLLTDPQGSVRDPQVHYDGGRIIFSYRPGGADHYHLYEINADGTGLRQLTDGDCDDIEPAYLPDDHIVFCSSRCHRYVQCWFTHVAILYRCDADGRNVRAISANVEHDNTPWPLPDGRILYTRWEYVDRSQVRYHHLWTINPDGTGQMTYFGNMHPGGVFIDAKPVPGTRQAVFILSPGHGRRSHMGDVGIIDPDAGPDEKPAMEVIAGGGAWRDPYAVAADCFLAARENALCVLNRKGEYEQVYAAADLRLHEPRPLAPRPRERLIPPRVNWSQPTGKLVLADVTNGRNMAGVKPGQIKKLLVLETLPKPVNFSGGQDAISPGGSFTIPRVLGTVPVEPDGSAYFEVPALRPVFFIAWDDRDLTVKRMQSFVSVMPGETTSCVGCHENRTNVVTVRANLQALQRPPDRITPVPDTPDVFDFSRHIQPILDRRCIGCHNAEKCAGGMVLTADRASIYQPWPASYTHLFRRVSQGANGDANRAPRTIGTAASLLMKKVDPEAFGLAPHNKQLNLPARERMMFRLWIESGAVYPGTYAALGNNFRAPTVTGNQAVERRCGSCHGHAAEDGSLRLTFKSPADKRLNLRHPEKSLLLLAPLTKQAGGLELCKGEYILYPDGQRTPPRRIPRPADDNPAAAKPQAPAAKPAKPQTLTDVLDSLLADPAPRPEPQPKEQPREQPEQLPPPDAKQTAPGPLAAPPVTRPISGIFDSTNDPDYQAILTWVRKTSWRGRIDMPDFRPNDHYIREMKRYGILRPDYTIADPIDVYALDQAYWKSFWHLPSPNPRSR